MAKGKSTAFFAEVSFIFKLKSSVSEDLRIVHARDPLPWGSGPKEEVQKRKGLTGSEGELGWLATY